MLVIISDLHLTDGTSGASLPAGAFEIFGERLRDLARRASYRADGSYRPIERLDLLAVGRRARLHPLVALALGHGPPLGRPAHARVLQHDRSDHDRHPPRKPGVARRLQGAGAERRHRAFRRPPRAARSPPAMPPRAGRCAHLLHGRQPRLVLSPAGAELRPPPRDARRAPGSVEPRERAVSARPGRERRDPRNHAAAQGPRPPRRHLRSVQLRRRPQRKQPGRRDRRRIAQPLCR